MQLYETTDNKLAEKVLKAVTDEERVQVGEFLPLLHELAPMKKRSLPREQKKWKIRTRKLSYGIPEKPSDKRIQQIASSC